MALVDLGGVFYRRDVTSSLTRIRDRRQFSFVAVELPPNVASGAGHPVPKAVQRIPRRELTDALATMDAERSRTIRRLASS